MKEGDQLDVYVSKYALTDGVFKVFVEVTQFPELVRHRGTNGHVSYYHKPFWHLTEAEAIKKANTMRNKAIAAAKKKIAKLRAMTFKAAPPQS